mmetsp:Transcript_15680/g.23034  ORF Transcript_15680/g.23034 Transcript_15680/m.23034 type:complete len:80 (+) Transcript_15680:1474-1713(+)
MVPAVKPVPVAVVEPRVEPRPMVDPIVEPMVPRRDDPPLRSLPTIPNGIAVIDVTPSFKPIFNLLDSRLSDNGNARFCP